MAYEDGETVKLQGWGFANCTTGKLLTSEVIAKWCIDVEKPELDEVYEGEYEYVLVEISYKVPQKPGDWAKRLPPGTRQLGRPRP